MIKPFFRLQWRALSYKDGAKCFQKQAASADEKLKSAVLAKIKQEKDQAAVRQAVWQVKLNTTEPRQRIIRAKDTAKFKRDFEKKEEVIDITEQTTLFDWQ